MVTWQEFYEKYYDWAESTLLKKISSLREMGPASEVVECASYISEEAAEKLLRKAMSMGVVFTANAVFELDSVISEDFALVILDRYMATGQPVSFEEIQNLDTLVPQEKIDQIILYDLKLGYPFTPKQITEMDGLASEKVLTEALRKCEAPISAEELEDLDGLVDEKLLREIDKKQKTHVFDDEDWDHYKASSNRAAPSRKKPGLLSRLGALFAVHEVDKMIREDDTGKREEKYHSWSNKPRKFQIGETVYVRRNGHRQAGTIADLDMDGRYSVRLNDGRFLEGIRESEIEKKGLLG